MTLSVQAVKSRLHLARLQIAERAPAGSSWVMATAGAR